MGTELPNLKGAISFPRVITHMGDGDTALTNRDMTADIADIKAAIQSINASRRQVKKITMTHTGTVPAGASEDDYYTVPSGKSWLLTLYGPWVLPVSGATSGEHLAYVWLTGAASAPRLGKSSAYNASLSADTPLNLLHFAVPSGGDVRIQYYNLTNADQTSNRNHYLGYIEETN